MPSNQTTVETKNMIITAITVAAAITAYFTIGSFFFTTESRTVTLVSHFGHLTGNTYTPGLHLKWPFAKVHHFDTEEQVDSVQSVPCGTMDGIMLEIPEIHIHNKLPADKARSAYLRAGSDYDKLWVFRQVKFFVGQKCTELTAEEAYLTKFNDFDEYLTNELKNYQKEKETGLIILKTKFRKPEAKNSDILDEFKKRAEAKAQRKALLAKEDTIKQENSNALKVAKGKNDLDAAQATAQEKIKTLALQAEISRRQQAAEAARIEGQINNLKEFEKAENQAKIEVESAKAKLKAMKFEAEWNKYLLTPEYIELERTKALKPTDKLYFGEQVGNIWKLLKNDKI
jgi:hypothetical protein